MGIVRYRTASHLRPGRIETLLQDHYKGEFGKLSNRRNRSMGPAARAATVLLFVLVLFVLQNDHHAGLVQAWKRPGTAKTSITQRAASSSTSKRQLAIVESFTKKVQTVGADIHKRVQQGVTTIQRSTQRAPSSIPDKAAVWNRHVRTFAAGKPSKHFQQAAGTTAQQVQQAAGTTAQQVRDTMITTAEDGIERTRAKIHKATRPKKKKWPRLFFPWSRK